MLSANRITEVAADFLPNALRVLELRNNRLSSLGALTRQRPLQLQYLGLASNPLGSPEDVSNLTGRHWPQLLCLDLSFCDFEDHRVLLGALCSLPRLRTLLLEGNPFALGLSYPGLTVDSLPQLSCLDTVWISPEERRSFRGLAQIRDESELTDCARASVSVGRLRGICDPLTIPGDDSAPDFPGVSFSYVISYDFPVHTLSEEQKIHSEGKKEGAVTEDDSREAKPCSNAEREAVDSSVKAHGAAHVSTHSTSKLPWAESMDFSDARTHLISDLRGFKSFLNRGMSLRLEEEKILSWPVASEDAAGNKPGRTGKETKGGKGKESQNKPASIKDKKKKSPSELVLDAPIRRMLGSVHVPLDSLLQRGQRVDILCDFGVICSETGRGTTHNKDLGKNVREEKKEEKGQRLGISSGKKTAAPKGKAKAVKEPDVHSLSSVSIHLEPVTVELRVELGRWTSVAEAGRGNSFNQ